MASVTTAAAKKQNVSSLRDKEIGVVDNDARKGIAPRLRCSSLVTSFLVFPYRFRSICLQKTITTMASGLVREIVLAFAVIPMIICQK